MFIRYQSISRPFLALSGLTGVALLFYWFFAVGDGTQTVASTQSHATAGSKESPGQGRANSSEDEQYQRVLSHAEGSATPKGKIKDALGRGQWKLNLYEDTGDKVYDRFKLDRNRDDVWDEAWTRKADGHWERDGDGKRLGGSLAPAQTAPAQAQPVPLEPAQVPAAASGAESELLAPSLQAGMTELRSGRAKEARVKDFNRGKGPKLSLYDDDGDGRWDRAKVDHERDEVWDEKWTHKPDGTVERKSEHSGAVSVLSDGKWVGK
jgi:hypothetical protein